MVKVTGYSTAFYESSVAAKAAMEALDNKNDVRLEVVSIGAKLIYVVIYRPKIVLESIPLTDVDGTNTICTQNTTNDNLYDIILAEAGTATFYPDLTGDLNAVISKIGLICTGGGAMNVHFVYKPISSWVNAGAISESYTTDNYLAISAAQGAKWTYLQPNMPFSGVPWGIAVDLNAAGTITMQLLKEA